MRIAHRLRDMQTLPYIVVTQEHVARVYEVRVYIRIKLAVTDMLHSALLGRF